MEQIIDHYEVLIVGGGPAGLAAAMSLGRMAREVLLCDDGRPRNAPAAQIHDFPSHEGIAPSEWLKEARRDLERYKSVHFHNCVVGKVERSGNLFRAELATGQVVRFKKMILAHGILDTLPPAAGFKELWGKAVFHCPYCHGYEVRGRPLALVGNGELKQFLPMIFSLSPDLILFTDGKARLSADLWAVLRLRKIQVIEERILSLRHEGPHLRFIELENGKTYDREYVFLAPHLPYRAKSEIGEQLGCEKNASGLYNVDASGRTSVPGVFAAGDLTSGMHSVVGSMASGQTAGAGAAMEILSEKFWLSPRSEA